MSLNISITPVKYLNSLVAIMILFLSVEKFFLEGAKIDSLLCKGFCYIENEIFILEGIFSFPIYLIFLIPLYLFCSNNITAYSALTIYTIQKIILHFLCVEQNQYMQYKIIKKLDDADISSLLKSSVD